MRRVIGVLMFCASLSISPAVFAVERRLDQLPGDVANLAFFWTEPIKQVAKQSREHDPISGVWLGLVDGSVKSFERSAGFFLYKDDGTPNDPPQDGKLLKYSF